MAIRVRSGQGPRGTADVSYNSAKRLFTVIMDDNKYTILREDAPSYLAKLLASKPMRLRVSMNVDCTQILNAGPIGPGSCPAVFSHFTHRDNEQPAPRMVQGGTRKKKSGETWTAPDQLQFTAIFRVVSGKYAVSPKEGCEIAYQIPYAFTPVPDQPELGMDIAGKGSQKLMQFLQHTGIDFTLDTIPVSENVLPWLQDVLKEREEVVILNLNEDGYVDTISPIPDGMTFTDTVMEE